MREEYGIPQELSEALHEEGLLCTNNKEQAFFIKQTIDNLNNPAFCFATQGEIKRAIVTDNPTEALSAFLIDEDQKQTVPTLYLSIEQPEELPQDLLKSVEEVIVGIQAPRLKQEVCQLIPHAQLINNYQSLNQIWQAIQEKKQLEVSEQKKQHLDLLARERQRQNKQIEL